MSEILLTKIIEGQYNRAFVLLTTGKFSPEAADETGRTAVHLAAQQGFVGLLPLLARLGFDVNAKSTNGWTPLHDAVSSKKRACVAELIRLGARLNEQTREKQRTPLHVAANIGALLEARLLIKAGADATIEDRIDIARKKGHVSIANLAKARELVDLYDEENESDTDSEDEEDYHFEAPVFLKPPKPSKSKKHLTGNLDGEDIDFREEWINSNGDCGFIGLGTDRRTLTEILRARANEPEVRESIWPEIAEAIVAGELNIAGGREALDVYYAAPDAETNPFELFCMRPEIFGAYLDLLADEGRRLWLGYYTALAYARIQQINLFIWHRNTEGHLALATHNRAEEARGEYHLLHMGGFTHFNLLVRYEADPVDEVTQSVDELALDDPSTAEPEEKKDEPKEAVIAHYRGVHFYGGHFSRSQRRNAIRFHRGQEAGLIARMGMFSAATHELAGIGFSFPQAPDDGGDLDAFNQRIFCRESRLEEANRRVVRKMHQWQRSDGVIPVLGRVLASREHYPSRYTEFIQRYVNSYKTLSEDMAAAPGKDLNDGRLSARTRKKWCLFQGLGFSKLPLVSTSEILTPALKYATAILNWDKTGTHQPREMGVTPVLAPCYQRDGHPRFPYLGILYVTLHKPHELTPEVTSRIAVHFARNEIDLSAGPGGHERSGYIKALERVFIGGIDADHIKLGIVIRVPSFYFHYRDFVYQKYGMDENTYNRFKKQLSRYGAQNTAGRMVNERGFHSTQQRIIEFIIEAKAESLKVEIAAVARELGYELKYFGKDETDLVDEPAEIGDFVGARHQGPGT